MLILGFGSIGQNVAKSLEALFGIDPLDSGVCDWVTRNFERMIGRWDDPR